MSKQFTTTNLKHVGTLADGTKIEAREIDAFNAAKKASPSASVSQSAWVHRVSFQEGREVSAPLAKLTGPNAKARAEEYAKRQNDAYAPHGFYKAVVTVR